MANRHHYVLTSHVKQRYIQRTNKKYSHMQDCKFSLHCEKCRILSNEIYYELTTHGNEIVNEIRNRLNLAEENRHYLNNSNFMSRYYEKFGYDNRFEFLTHEDILFVVVEENSKKTVVTCVAAKTHLAGRSCNHKFKKKSPTLS